MIETANLILVPCELKHFEAILTDQRQLEQMLDVTVFDNWFDFIGEQLFGPAVGLEVFYGSRSILEEVPNHYYEIMVRNYRGKMVLSRPLCHEFIGRGVGRCL